MGRPFGCAEQTVAAFLLLIRVRVAEGRPAIRREDWLRVGLAGLTGIGVSPMFFTVGLRFTTAHNALL